ncbi:dephospho-CoA kinase [Parasediminibacterium sp. JCM 36343]|uniref:dephospho-CoA kinase n=1 Tax=Parasediminibacterium sp. JCM 36343 TaxID=3374279 RepID=UPI00397DE676
MLKIGLTGGIGSGKSVVAAIFKTLGIPVFDADSAAKKIMEEDASLIEAIKTAFGNAAYTTEGKLNRKYIADIVFNDSYQLEVLNNITHPATIRAAEAWMQQQHAPYCIKEAALLFEAGTAGNLDYIIGVSAPEALRINRVMQRDNTGRQDVLTRIGKQIKQEIKMRLCDFVILNNEQQLLIPQVMAIHEKLVVSRKS